MAKVFVVDDEQAIRQILAAHLRIKGHEMVLEAGTLPEALDELARVKKLGVQVAIIDGAFPNSRDGAALAAVLRNQAPCVKIVSFSGGDLQTWGDRNLRKPDDFNQLVQAIEELLKA